MNYKINNYRFKRFGEKYFLTTDHGSYLILTKDEFNNFRKGNINGELKKKLEQREIILTNENIDETVRLMRNRYNFLFRGTSLHIVVVTLRCNMNCVYCQASSRPMTKKEYDMDKETAKKTVDFIFQSQSSYLTIEFQGGEPLLNWDVVKFITEYAQEKNKKEKRKLEITMVTNMVDMNHEKMNYLINHNVSVCTSLDGPKELHDHNRKFAEESNYEQVVKWIKIFNEEYNKRNIKDKQINALVTLTRESMKSPKEIVDEYVKLGLGIIHLRFLNKIGVAKKTWTSINSSVEEYMNFWIKAVTYIEELKKKGIKINERMVGMMYKKINTEFDFNYLDLRTPCGAVIGQLAYNHNGDIYPCDEARMVGDDMFLLGNVKSNKYKNIIGCDKSCVLVNASINDQYICDGCVYKPYCGVCPVCNYEEHGNIIGPISKSGRCMIFKKQFDWVVKEKFINKKKQ